MNSHDWFLLIMLCLGILIGRYIGRRSRKSLEPPLVQPICPCSHVWGEHREGGRCLGQVRRPYYASWGTRNGHQWVNCACTKYHGPEMVTKEFFSPGTFAPPEV